MKFNLKETFGTISKFADEHKPELATGAGIIFMVGGTVAAVVATVKTMKACSAAKEEKLAEIAPTREAYDDLTAEEMQEYDEIENSPLPIKEAAAVSWKWWILPIGLIAGGTGSILYSDHEQAKRIAGLMTKVGALAFQAAEAKDYKEAAKELLGEKKEKEVEDEAARKSVERRSNDISYEPDNYPHLAPGNVLFQEYYSMKRFYANWNYIDGCLNEYNNRLNSENNIGNRYLGLYEWYDILGLSGYTGKAAADRPGCGEDLAFRTDKGLLAIVESNDNAFQTEDKKNCYLLRFNRGAEYRDDNV